MQTEADESVAKVMTFEGDVVGDTLAILPSVNGDGEKIVPEVPTSVKELKRATKVSLKKTSSAFKFAEKYDEFVDTVYGQGSIDGGAASTEDVDSHRSGALVMLASQVSYLEAKEKQIEGLRDVIGGTQDVTEDLLQTKMVDRSFHVKLSADELHQLLDDDLNKSSRTELQKHKYAKCALKSKITAAADWEKILGFMSDILDDPTESKGDADSEKDFNFSIYRIVFLKRTVANERRS